MVFSSPNFKIWPTFHHRIFFWLVIDLIFFFLEIARNYILPVIDSSKCLPQPPSPLPYLINFLLLWSGYLQKNAFSKKIRFSLWAHYWSVLILLFWVYVFYGSFLQFCHYEKTNKKLLLFFRFPKKITLRLLLPP